MTNKKVNKKTNVTKGKDTSIKKQTNDKQARIELIIYFVILVGITALFYFLFGLQIAIITFAGLFIILLFAKLFDITRRNKKKRKIVKVFLIIFLVICILGVLAVSGFAIYIVVSAPKWDNNQLNSTQSSILYDSDGNEFAKLGSEIRENINYEDLPEIFVDALIATEDSRFFQHNGIDLARFAKAAFLQLLGKDDAGGGSTLSMQVIKNKFTSFDDQGIKGIIRKFTDIYLAVFKLEKNFTKEQIIEFYANNHVLGGAWGVEEASKYYFGKSAKDMNLAEASLIAGMYQAPGAYNPYRNPEAAEKRRKTVLNLMVRHGYITREEADLAASIPISSLLSNAKSNQNIYQSYIDLVREEISEKYGLDPQSTSMLVYTNLNRKKQDGLNAIANGETFDWIDDYVQTGVVAIDSATGKIEALIGNRTDDRAMVWNYATDTSNPRQIGSTAKPLFDYAPGIEYNNWSTYTLFDDSPYTYSSGQPIKNFDGNYEGLITLRRALSNSRNIPALKAFQQLDKKKVIELVTSVGITPEIENNTLHEAHAIGAFNGATALQVAGAYQIFSNGGKYTEPYTVSKIVLRATGQEIKNENPTKQIISDATSYMIADVLKGVVNDRMRNYRFNITDNFAAKTGTTNYPSDYWDRFPGLPSDAIPDAWITGFTNKTVFSIWYGYPKIDPEHLDRVLHWNPATVQKEILFNAVANAVFDHDGTDFEMPSSVVRVPVEVGTNPPMLPSSKTPSDRIVYELFKKGTEPTEVSNAYSKLDAPRNLSVNYKNNKVTLSWSGVDDPKYVTNGVFGYYVYYNDKLMGFTTKTTYTIDNQKSYLGTYSVKAGYKDTTNSMSEATSQTLKTETSYSLELKNSNTTYVNIGELVDKSLYDGSLVVLKENGKTVSKSLKSYLKISITNSTGDSVSKIETKEAESYTVTYTINYNGYVASISNKITIREN